MGINHHHQWINWALIVSISIDFRESASYQRTYSANDTTLNRLKSALVSNQKLPWYLVNQVPVTCYLVYLVPVTWCTWYLVPVTWCTLQLRLISVGWPSCVSCTCLLLANRKKPCNSGDEATLIFHFQQFIFDKNGQQLTSMDNNWQQWTTMNYGKLWTTLDNNPRCNMPLNDELSVQLFTVQWSRNVEKWHNPINPPCYTLNIFIKILLIYNLFYAMIALQTIENDTISLGFVRWVKLETAEIYPTHATRAS